MVPGDCRRSILGRIGLFKNIRVPVIFEDVDRFLDLSVMISFCNKLSYKHNVDEGGEKKFFLCVKA
jgi:hypothetical protein